MSKKLTLTELNTLEVQSGIKNILTQNSKLKKTSEYIGKTVLNFSIPAHKAMNGDTICPFAGTCLKYCYAQKGNYTYNKIQLGMEYKYQLSKHKDLFIERINREIKDKKPGYIRVHDSGDYYSLEYMKTWFHIANNNPDIVFYSYTKSHSMVRLAYRLGIVPDNYVFIFSIGSIQDNLIDRDNERHALIFDTLEDLIADGYVNASETDVNALDKDNHKIGLIKH